MNYSRIGRLIARYTTEILIIFIGITISFLFDQWRENQENRRAEKEFLRSLKTDLQAKREEINSDNPHAEFWIQRLDSIQRDRKTGNVSKKQLAWLFKIMLQGGAFFFNASTPTFSGALGTPTWQSLPDSSKRKIYHVFMEDLEWNHLAYKQLSETMNEFRNTSMGASGILALNLSEGSPEKDFSTFADEISRPEYGGYIQSVIQGERLLLRKGQATIKDIDILIFELDLMIGETRH